MELTLWREASSRSASSAWLQPCSVLSALRQFFTDKRAPSASSPATRPPRSTGRGVGRRQVQPIPSRSRRRACRDGPGRSASNANFSIAQRRLTREASGIPSPELEACCGCQEYLCGRRPSAVGRLRPTSERCVAAAGPGQQRHGGHRPAPRLGSRRRYPEAGRQCGRCRGRGRLCARRRPSLLRQSRRRRLR